MNEKELLLDCLRRLNRGGVGVVHVQRGKLDEAYLRRWAAELRVSAELEAALSGAIRPKHT